MVRGALPWLALQIFAQLRIAPKLLGSNQILCFALFTLGLAWLRFAMPCYRMLGTGCVMLGPRMIRICDLRRSLYLDSG